MKNKILLLISGFAFVLLLQSCTKEKDSSANTSLSDQSIARIAHSNSDLLLVSTFSKLSTQSSFRIKMNRIASNSFLSGQKNDFPLNSMIVREAINENGIVTGYDIMYRSSSDLNSSFGWLWTRADGNGNVLISANEKGAQCQSCHNSGTGSLIDL